MTTEFPNNISRLIGTAILLVGSARQVMADTRCSEDAFREYCGGKEPKPDELETLLSLIAREQNKTKAEVAPRLKRAHGLKRGFLFSPLLFREQRFAPGSSFKKVQSA